MQETLRALPIAPVAGEPPFLLCLAVIRGEPTPVGELAKLLASDHTKVDRTRLATLEPADRRVAFAVEQVIGVRKLDAQELNKLYPLLKSADLQLIESISSSDQQLLVVLHAARLIPEEEFPRVAAFD